MSARLILASAMLVCDVLGNLAWSADAPRDLDARKAAGLTPVARSGGQPVDESALRYYASRKQKERVDVEIRRLQRNYPNWRAPADLWTARPSSENENELWELYASDNLEGLHKAIEARRTREPGWTPSTDLAKKFRRKELRKEIIANKLMGRWATAAAAADRGDFGPDTGDVETLWDIAEVYARTKRPEDALNILTLVLRTRSESQERFATVQRAISLLPMIDAERLIAMARTDTNGESEFSSLGIDITRARIGAFLHDQPANNVSVADLTAFRNYARAAADANQAGLVAWYALKRGDLYEALEWFKTAIAQGGDATMAHGLAHTLRKLGQLREAEEVAYAWREPSATNMILFIDIMADQLTRAAPVRFEADRLSRFAAVTTQTSSGEGAQALAWYAYNSCQFEISSDWFRRAVAWFPKETTVFGYALTLRRLKRQQEFVEIVNRYDGLFPKVLTLLFPEQGAEPASPCDGPAPAKTGVAARSAEFLDLSNSGNSKGRMLQQGRLGQAVPGPPVLSVEVANNVPQIRRSDFPIAVAPENPLRFPTAETFRGISSMVTEWRERGVFAAVTVARRVPGVGVLPYEKYGLKLQSAWNGTDQPNLSANIDAQAPIGTVWYAEHTALATDTSRVATAARPGAASSASDASPPGGSAPSRFHP
ncbi:hypothetical protein FIU28_06410 [Tardiphaga sp. vice154]|uniref:hypothetical protein n=1 Tax=Tardiphaga sp. vice154 TaxID=2592814 RepID=UPI001161F19B|nr:hypothetical protein [Tardiphaga sp. vice154]QDM20799.1 hypothetical protein FIU28_06410 [Tardiphaga sp. vice154]